VRLPAAISRVNPSAIMRIPVCLPVCLKDAPGQLVARARQQSLVALADTGSTVSQGVDSDPFKIPQGMSPMVEPGSPLDAQGVLVYPVVAGTDPWPRCSRRCTLVRARRCSDEEIECVIGWVLAEKRWELEAWH
jgi:hypothetical protein